MKFKSEIIIVCLSIFLMGAIVQCRSDKHVAMNEVKSVFKSEGRFLIGEKYDSLGKLRIRKYFNEDTIADGAEIHFYANGKIEKWIWFLANNKVPCAGVYYDTNGIYTSYKGVPLIGANRLNKKDMFVQMINPPSVKIYIEIY